MSQEILKQCTVEGLVVKLPPEQLPRDTYNSVKKALELIGGKWKSGKTQGFVFEQDPTELLAAIANGEDRNLKKEYQFFPTPAAVAERMVAHLPWIGPDFKILEPSAGDGALINALVSADPGYTKNIDCFEIMDLNRMKLAKVTRANLIGKDFLQTDTKDTYDIVFANPPFTKNQDIFHIWKMFEVLKPGGTIVTLASPSWATGSSKKQLEFFAWLKSLDATIEDIEAGAFKESGTSIHTKLLVIKKPVVEKAVEEKVDDAPTETVIEDSVIPVTIEPINVPISFFEKMFPLLENIDINIMLQRKEGLLSVSVFPQSLATIEPLNITGLPSELDEGFIGVITGPLADANVKRINLDDYKVAPTVEEVEEVKKEEPIKKVIKKDISKKIIKPVAPDLFAEVLP